MASHQALWRVGFRPFYLLASAFASLSVALWILQYAGWLPRPYLSGPPFHAHEMLFGFASAVIAGFLFTAVRNWTGLPTPSGPALAALAGLWLAGRILVLTPWLWAAAAANVAFPVALAIAIGVPLSRSGNRNVVFVGALLLIAIGALLLYLAQLAVVPLPPALGIQLALDAVLLVISIMAGRVIPAFTNNAVRSAGARQLVPLERLSIASVLVLLLADAAQVRGAALVIILGCAAVLHGIRLILWRPDKTFGVPLLWILHAGYAWIPVHLILRAVSQLGYVAPSLAVHALTLGAIGGLTMGMMTRTALGHTGRPLKAERGEAVCYTLVMAAAIVRVIAPIVAPDLYSGSVIASGCLWSAAYALYAVRYWPILTGPSLGLDGANGRTGSTPAPPA